MVQLRRCLGLFGLFCLTTFLLNYSLVKDFHFGPGPRHSYHSISQKNSLVMRKIVRSDTMNILNYRRSRSAVDDGGNLTAFEPSAVHGAMYVPSYRVSLFNCSLDGNPGKSTANVRNKKDVSRVKGQRVVHRNGYAYLVDFAPASRTFGCNESITYTTHGEFRYLDNLIPLAERWEGPISIALYAPGSDMLETVRRIQYLRECTTPLIKELVSFHLFFDSKFNRDTPLPPKNILNESVDCTIIPSFSDEGPSFRKKKQLTYPVNVARNLARNRSTTFFVLPSDIELYPSLNLIPYFLDMIARQEVVNTMNLLNSDNNDTAMGPNGTSDKRTANPRVFVLPLFEVEEGFPIPDSKDDLQHLLQRSQAVPFHKYVCYECHRIPKYYTWLTAPYIPNQINVLHTGKRKYPYQVWEPIYIGTNQDPLYDERLSWEGLRDKMSQGYVLCILDYDFLILDNAFLVHRPGIKKRGRSKKPTLAILRQNTLLQTTIMREVHKTYGKRPGCFL